MLMTEYRNLVKELNLARAECAIGNNESEGIPEKAHVRDRPYLLSAFVTSGA